MIQNTCLAGVTNKKPFDTLAQRGISMTRRFQKGLPFCGSTLFQHRGKQRFFVHGEYPMGQHLVATQVYQEDGSSDMEFMGTAIMIHFPSSYITFLRCIERRCNQRYPA